MGRRRPRLPPPRRLPEGKLTDLRKTVVNAAALAQVADRSTSARLLLGKGEDAAGGRRSRRSSPTPSRR